MILHHFPGNSPLHRWDGRCKCLALISVSIILFHVSIVCFSLHSLLLISLFFLARIPLRSLLRDLKFWGLWLLVLFLLQVLFSPGKPLSFLPWLPLSREGLGKGLLSTWRLGLLLGYALLFTAVTRPRELVEVLTWLARPFPFLPARRLAMMVSLALRFFSRFLDQAEEVRLALRARLGERIRNPIRRAKYRALPILRRSFLEVEETTYALMARGYREDLSPTLAPIPILHWIPLGLFWGALLFSFWW